jgi:hypothetical protein
MEMRPLLALALLSAAACSAPSAETTSAEPEPASSSWTEGGPDASVPPDASVTQGAPVEVPSKKDDPTWPCASSSYKNNQFWTCTGGAIHKCEGASPKRIDCAYGCVFGALGTDDSCNPTAPAPLPMPELDIVIKNGLFTETQLRQPLENGLRYALDRMQKLIALDGKQPPAKITVTYAPATTPYCYAFAYTTTIDVWCPVGYPITGENQNIVTNISVHEFGHILALHLIGPDTVRDICVNEGLASWIAGRYWMNDGRKAVASHKAAALADIAKGKASATLATCISASDAWYKVYASYFEYLELFVPDGVRSVSTGSPKSAYIPAWQAWMATP